MELKELRSLACLERSGTLTSVAGSLHRSPGAIHKQLRVLERELGVKLYERLGRRLQLTHLARRMLPHVRQILDNYEAVLHVVEENAGLRQGTVHVGAGPGTATYILPPILRAYRRRFPRIELLVETGSIPSILESLQQGRIDLAMVISSGVAEERDYTVHWSAPMDLVLVSDLRDIPARCSIHELAKYPFILFPQESRIQRSMNRYFEELGFHPRVAMRFDNSEAIKAMIRAHLGVSMLPMWAVDDEVRRGLLSIIKQDEPPLKDQLVLVSRRGGYSSPAVDAFVAEAKLRSSTRPRLLRPR